MSDRFYLAEPIRADRVTLDGAEAHHLLHVMRAGVATEITLFDDSGAEFDGVVESVSRAEAAVRITARREVDRELPFALVAGVALPKGDRQKWLVEKLTELGVTTLVPLGTKRGVAQPTGGAVERLERAVIEAAKQCGRNRLMRIAKPQAWGDWFQAGDLSAESLRFVAHPGGSPLHEVELKAAHEIRFAIGPEGGFTDEEVSAAIAVEWQAVSLGARILRVETAAMALAAAMALGR